MPKSSKMPDFKSEAEEAEWWASPEGRRHTRAEFRKAKKRGIIRVTDRSPEALDAAHAESKRTGKLIVSEVGTDIKRTDPAKLQEIMDRVKAKSEMKMIALRLPTADIDAAKRLATKNGVRYQTLLKEIIHEAVGRAS